MTLIASAPAYYQHSECGYCHGKKENFLGLSLPAEAAPPSKCTSATIGTHVEQMTSLQYDLLLNRNFRRSGTFLYKNDMLRACCRMYTIRTDLGQMKISKEHRQLVNRFKRAIGDPLEQDSEKREDSKKEGKKSRFQRPPPFQLSSLIVAEQQSSRFRTVYEPAVFSEEKFALYKKYQVRVHQDEPESVTKLSFSRFLCLSPFPETELMGTAEEWNMLNSWTKEWKKGKKWTQARRVGPTHECYYLDDVLIAISVLDFLPSGLSSVYFIWDPDYAHLSLGTVLGLREIQMCHELGLGYYYLGYYIEDCPKMRYKAKFGGELLDVCNEAFAPLQKVVPLIKEGRFFTLDSLRCSGEDGLCEIKIDLAEEPEKWPIQVKDVSDQLYGSLKVYDVAKSARVALIDRLGLAGGNLSVPDVFPGALPLYQILGWFESGELDVDFPVCIYDCELGIMHRGEFSKLPPRLKCVVVDGIRLLGLDMFFDSFLYG